MPKPIIDQKKCNKCGTCVEICPVQVFKAGEKVTVDKSDECIGCRSCEAQCPASAIKVED